MMSRRHKGAQKETCISGKRSRVVRYEAVCPVEGTASRSAWREGKIFVGGRKQRGLVGEAGRSISSFKIFIQYEKSGVWGKIRSSNLDPSSVDLSNEDRSLDIQDCSFKIKDFKTIRDSMVM